MYVKLTVHQVGFGEDSSGGGNVGHFRLCPSSIPQQIPIKYSHFKNLVSSLFWRLNYRILQNYTPIIFPFPLFMIVHPQLVTVISDLFPYFRILHADPQRWSHSVLERNVRRNHVHSRRLPGFITKENG